MRKNPKIPITIYLKPNVFREVEKRRGKIKRTTYIEGLIDDQISEEKEKEEK